VTAPAEGSAMPRPGGLPEVSVVELETVRVAAVRSMVAAGDVPDFMSDALSLVATALREAGIAPAGPPLARYWPRSASRARTDPSRVARAVAAAVADPAARISSAARVPPATSASWTPGGTGREPAGPRTARSPPMAR